MNLRLKRRDIALIIGFWLIGFALLAVVFWYIVSQDTAPLPAPDAVLPQATFTVTHQQVTAKSVKPQIEQQLALWQDDAQLYSITATWDQTDLQQVGQPVPWTYRFYSPGQKRIYFITAKPDGQVIGTSHGERVYKPPIPIPADAWNIDSAEALNIWLNHGGAALTTAIPGLQVVAQLQIGKPDDPLSWVVVGYDNQSKNYHTAFINAQSGQVDKIESSLGTN